MHNQSELETELSALLNRVSAENGSDTPDYILAAYLLGCLDAFNAAVRHREAWYGREAGSGRSILGADFDSP